MNPNRITDATLQRLERAAKEQNCTVDALLNELLDLRSAQNNARYESIVQTQPDLICRYDTALRLTFVNAAYCRFFGKTEAELLGTSFMELIPEAHHDYIAAYVRSLWENPRVQTHEQPMIAADGSLHWLAWLDEVICDKTGTPIEIQTVARDITERHHAEDRLRESEERFATVANTAPVMIWISGLDAECFFFNERWLGFTGRTLAEELSVGWHTGIHPDDYDFCMGTYLDAFNARVPFTMEYRLRRADGVYRWITDSGVPRFTPSGEFLGYIGSCIDITERKQAEQELIASREAMERLIQQLPVGIQVFDAHGNCVDVNQAHLDIFGVSREDLVGRYNIFDDDFAAQVTTQNATRRALQGETVSLGDLEFDFSQADPRYAVTSQATRTVNVMLVPIFDQGQYVVNIVGVNMDITERKKAEKALAQNEARLRSLVESQTALVVRTDIRGDFTYVSPSWLKRFGWMKERFIGTPSLETLLEEDRPKALEVVIWCIEHPGESTQIVLRKPTQEGIVVHTLWEFIGITDGAGNVTEIQCVGFDVTAQMLAEQIRLEQERLKASLKKEREFNALVQKAVAALAHDIRTPLTAISTARDVLDMYFDRLDEDRRREKLDSIKRQLQYVLMLLNDMSLTVKGSLDQHFFQPAPVNLRTLCQITVSELQQSIGGKHRMVFITDEQIDVALIDETLVSRILLNLLSNAVKFSPHGKEIILELTRRADRIVLRVIDHGIGISKEDQRHLFEPFFRSESVRGIGGTGLGLSIVKDCVERHQGTLHVESVLGQGTTFALELPILNP